MILTYMIGIDEILKLTEGQGQRSRSKMQFFSILPCTLDKPRQTAIGREKMLTRIVLFVGLANATGDVS